MGASRAGSSSSPSPRSLPRPGSTTKARSRSSNRRGASLVRLVALFLLGSATAAGCGDDDEEPTAAGTGETTPRREAPRPEPPPVGDGRGGRFFVNSTDPEGDPRIQESRRDADDPRVADPGTRRELLRIEQPFENHNGGLLLFGPDDLLYVGSGDGGSGGDPMRNGQELSTLLGKLLRIDPNPADGRPYAIPSSNPFVDEPGARGEIYSYGLRNPWRFSFDRVGGALSLGDVGQDAIEEIDLVAREASRGANFGWSAFEGNEPFNEDQEAPDAVSPALTYPLDGACAVTGGYVVRDESLRSLYARYLYGDFCVGELRSFTARPGRDAADDRLLGVDVPQLSSFGEDNRGRIYAVSLNGPVYRLAPRG